MTERPTATTIRSVLPKDAITSIDDPVFDDEYFGEDDDLVIVVESTPPRAYPIRILHYHEIVNDELPGEGPIVVTWCPLCGSAVVYDRQVGDQTLTFGVSGKLADDDLVMYDRQTDSEWKQSSGRCIEGPLDGTELEIRPAPLLPWAEFRREYPTGVVLQPTGTDSEVASDDDEPAPIDYDVEPYEQYFAADGFGLMAHREAESDRDWDRTDIGPKTVVLGIESDEEAIGFPLPVVERMGGVVHSTVGTTDAVVFAVDEELHAFANPGYRFEPRNGEFTADGTVWNGQTGTAGDGRELRRLPARRLFAFTWQDDHGPEAFYLDDTEC